MNPIFMSLFSLIFCKQHKLHIFGVFTRCIINFEYILFFFHFLQNTETSTLSKAKKKKKSFDFFSKICSSEKKLKFFLILSFFLLYFFDNNCEKSTFVYMIHCGIAILDIYEFTCGVDHDKSVLSVLKTRLLQ